MASWPGPGYAGPGYGLAAGAASTLLASDADRDRAAEVLKSGFAEGRLDKNEYDVALERVYTARTNGELMAATSQLPGGGMALYAAPPVPRTNSLAVAALVCGLGQFLLGPLPTIPAIVLGHAARRQIRRTGENGSGIALTGLILGWVGAAGLILLATVAFIGLAFVSSRHGVAVHVPGPGSAPIPPPPPAAPGG